MGRPKLKLDGIRFGALVAKEFLPKPTYRWKCVCDCGATSLVSSYCLQSGKTASCGCLGREMTKSGARTTTHGGSKTKEYRHWLSMRARCYRPSANGYERYGARGIRVEDCWRHSFSVFLNDMGPMPSALHTIEREKSDLNYGPSNCRWATRLEQARNKSNTVKVEYDGEIRTLLEVCEQVGAKYSLVYKRIKELGWDLDRALKEKACRARR